MYQQPEANPASFAVDYNSYLDACSREQLERQLQLVTAAAAKLTVGTSTFAREYAELFAKGIRQRLRAFEQVDQADTITVMPLQTYSVDEHLDLFVQY